MGVARTIGLFIAAAICEVGGAYLIWRWRRESGALLTGIVGVVLLVTYSLVQTAQALNFGRAFAAYGGVFIAMAVLWGWGIDHRTPDTWDWLGAGTWLVGSALIVWGPRG
jgi:small multidrug resistance family-3 protein